MKQGRYVLGLILSSAVCLFVWLLPVTYSTQNVIAVSPTDESIRLDHGFVVLNQAVRVPTPRPDEASLRLFIQRIPNYDPYLSVQAAFAGRVVNSFSVDLPPEDGAFHAVNLPWWTLPEDAQQISLAIRGNGVRVLTTRDRTLPGSTLKIEGLEQQGQFLALQLATRSGGLNSLVPLLRIAEGKPGVLGWPKLLLMLGVAYFALLGLLIPFIKDWLAVNSRTTARQSAAGEQRSDVRPPTPGVNDMLNEQPVHKT
jgi:hypothetical protein